MNIGFDPQSVMDVVNQNVTRPYNYSITIRLPDRLKDFLGLLSIDTSVKASSLPKLTVDHRDLRYKGRTIKIPDKVSYPGTWSCTFYLDDAYFVRDAIEKWMMMFDTYYSGANDSSSVFGMISNFIGAVKDGPAVSTATVTQDSKIGTAIQEYEFIGLFPISIEEMPLADDRIGQVNEFTVTFGYSYYIISDSSIIGQITTAVSTIGGSLGSIGGAVKSVGSAVGGAVSSVKSFF